MRIAIATQDLTRIDAHLGWARNLMFFEVSDEGYHHLRTASFPGGLMSDRLDALKGCAMVFVAQTDADGEFGLARHGVTPVRQYAGQPIAEALDALWNGLRANPTPWLRRQEQRHRANQCGRNGASSTG